MRLDAKNVARFQVEGPDAVGGIGDYALGNGTLCAIVSGPGHESDLSTTGGALADLGHCGRADDQFILLQTLLNLSAEGAVPTREVTARLAADAAFVTARGGRDGIEVETIYRVDLEDPRRILLTTRAQRTQPGERVWSLGDAVLHVNGSLRTWNPASGFHHPSFDLASLLEVARAIVPIRLHVLVGADGVGPGIAYGVRVLSARRTEVGEDGSEELPVFGLAAETFSSSAAFVEPFLFGGSDGVGILELLQSLLMDLSVGDVLVYEREVRIGERADVAAVVDGLLPESRPVLGRASDPEARVHVASRSGEPVTQVRSESDGALAFRLAEGAYRLRAVAPGGRTLERDFEVGPEGADLGEVALGESSHVELPRGHPMRLVFLGIDGTADPRFGDDGLDFRIGDYEPPPSLLGRDVHLGGHNEDPESVIVAPGRYRILATRGPEFDVSETTIEVELGGRVALVIEPPVRVMETPGWLSADLHVHGAPSDDSAYPAERRVASYVAQGTEVIVATDHERVTDYGPLVRELGLERRVASVVGVEITGNVPSEAVPRTIGHHNAFPIPRRPELYREGAPADEARRLRDVISAVRLLDAQAIVQLNHPRQPDGLSSASAFLTHLSVGERGFDPTLPLHAPVNRSLLERDPETGLRDLDFDAIELLNGPSLERYRLVREDWFAFLRAGEVKTATGNSDSHRSGEVAGVPVNYVRLESDGVTEFDEGAFIAAIRAGRLFSTTGPLLFAELEGVLPGGQAAVEAGVLRVEVRAAPWIPVERLRVLVDGTLQHEGPIARGETVLVPLEFEADAFVTVEVEGPAEGDYALLLPRFTPFAFTNPIFVDADGDGVWKPGSSLSLP